MDYKAFKKQLSKVERAYELLSKEGDGSEVEMDLLRAYTKKLYELTFPEGTPVVEEVVDSESIIEKEVVEAEAQDAPVMETPEEETIPPAQSVSIPPEVMELFETKEAVELSDKLSIATVSNIEQSMSINEKILTINDLFNGQNDAFKTCLAKLEGMSSFSEAKEYLASDIAQAYGWSDEEKKKKAIVFIELIHRRFA